MRKEPAMAVKYKVFIMIQLILSAAFFVLTFVTARLDPAQAPAALFWLGGIVLGTSLFLAMQPHLSDPASNRTARIILTVGYVLLAVISLDTLSEKTDLPALCTLIVSVAGAALYAESEHDRIKKRKDIVPAMIAEYLIMLLTLACSICGNIALLRSTAVSGKLCAGFGLLLLLAATVCLLIMKNCYAGKLHMLAFLISGTLLHKPYMYFVVLLFLAELFLVLHSKFGMFENTIPDAETGSDDFGPMIRM